MLRIMVSAALFVATVLFSLSQYDWQAQQLLADMRAKLQQFLYDYPLLVDCQSERCEKLVKRSVPQNKSWIWWKFNRGEVEIEMLRSPLVQSAEVSSCELPDFRCSEIHLRFREPSFALLGRDDERIALVDSSGQILPGMTGRMYDFPGVKIYTSEGSSTELLNRKMRYVASVLHFAQKERGKAVSAAELLKNGELRLRFVGEGFDLVFREDSSRLQGVENQMERLQIVLSRLSGELHDLQEIDLAYDGLAVVKRRDSWS